MKQIETLVEDIYDLFSLDPIKMDEKEVDQHIDNFGEMLKVHIKAFMYEEPRTRGNLRLSAIGKPDRQLWYDVNSKREIEDNNRSVIESAGLTISNKGDDRGDFVTIKRKVSRKDGTQRQGPMVKDSQNNAWDGKLIANGSLVNVKAVPFEWNYAGKSGVSADLAAVQVVDFIEYTSGADNDFDVVEGGYVTETASEEIPFAS